MNVDKDKPTFFKVRAYNREEKSPITPTFMYDDQRGTKATIRFSRRRSVVLCALHIL